MMRRVFAALLRLYPEHIQREFGPEMLEVFEQASADARQRGAAAYFRFVSREVGGLITNLIIEGAHVTHARNY